MDLSELWVSHLDVEANKSLVRKEIADKLKMPPSDIDLCFQSEQNGNPGIIYQYLIVHIWKRLYREDLNKLDFDFITKEGDFAFKIEETIL